MPIPADIQAKVNQLVPTVLEDAALEAPRMTKIGQLFTAGWRERLILAGKAYRLSIGTISGGDSFTALGTTSALDLDLPQGVVAVDDGVLIPLSVQGSVTSDTDAVGDYVTFLLTCDRTTAVLGSELAVGSNEVPDNLLDGGPTFGGRCTSILATTPITDPVHNDILHHDMWGSVGANNLGPVSFVWEKTFEYPIFLRGACSLLLYWGGTVQAHGMGSLCFAHIPASWIPLS